MANSVPLYRDPVRVEDSLLARWPPESINSRNPLTACLSASLPACRGLLSIPCTSRGDGGRNVPLIDQKIKHPAKSVGILIRKVEVRGTGTQAPESPAVVAQSLLSDAE